MILNLDKILFIATYIGTFFMYLQIIPVGIETQPIIPFVCLLLAVCFRFKKIFEVKNEELALLLFCCIILCYLLYGMFNGNTGESFIYCFRLIFCPLLYIFVLKNVEYIRIKHVKIVVSVLLCFCLSVSIYIPVLTEVVDFIIRLFLPRYSFGGGVRGVSVMTAEPSYFVYFAILIICTVDFLRLRNKNFVSKKEEFTIKFIIILMAILTKSALVYICNILYFIDITIHKRPFNYETICCRNVFCNFYLSVLFY